MTIRKSNRGSAVDLDALIKKAESSSLALGNMRVNAKGDQVGASGAIIRSNEDRVRDYYRDNPKSSTSGVSLKGAPLEKSERKSVDVTSGEDFSDPTSVTMPEKTSKKSTKTREVELPNGDIEIVPHAEDE